ncbi:MAG: phage/plasmid primase, P4 family [Bacilli bacterium]|nr:phage/plasmid primase, P4 family [Bacilli bacterium]
MKLKYLKLKANKVPMTRRDVIFDSLDNLENAGLLLSDNLVLVDFDNDNSNEMRIIQYLKANYNTLIVKTNRGCHFYYSKPKDLTIKNWSDWITVGGFQVDYKTGSKNYGVVKLNGKIRETNQLLTLDNLPELPAILYPLKSKNNITGLSEGEGRNNNLFKHLMLIKEQYIDVDINKIGYIINALVFNNPMESREVENIINSVIKREKTPLTNNINDITNLAMFLVKELDIKRYNKNTYIKTGIFYSSDEEILQRTVNRFQKLKMTQFNELKHQLITYSEAINENSIFKVKIKNGYIEDDKVVNCEDEFTPFYLDVKYEENAYDENVDQFLNFICCDRNDMRSFIEEMIGHVLMTWKHPAHLFFLTGNGKNGKSTFASMISTFAGDLSSFIDISKFNDGTCLLELKDKLVNVAEDIDNDIILRAKYLKTLASGEKIGERAIYSKPVKLKNIATLIFTTNDVPAFKDKTDGIVRRIKIIPFDNEVKVRNPKINELLSSDGARSYILNLGLQGISRIIKNNYELNDSPTINDATDKYYSNKDNIRAFLEQNSNIHNKITTDIYDSYKEFCISLEKYPILLGEFSRRLGKLGYSISNTTRNGKKVKVYKKDTLDTPKLKNL